MNYKTLTKAGLFCAIITICTMLIKLPIPQTNGGYVNFGDAVILLCAVFLANPFAALCAAIGSGLADVFLGAGIYVFPTFFIKGTMGAIASKIIFEKTNNKRIIVAATICEIIMITGYFVFDAFAFGFNAAVISLPFNLIQGLCGIVFGFFLIKFATKLKLQEKF